MQGQKWREGEEVQSDRPRVDEEQPQEGQGSGIQQGFGKQPGSEKRAGFGREPGLGRHRTEQIGTSQVWAGSE